MSEPPKIRIEHLSLGLGDQPGVLKDVSFSVPSARITALIGPSGSGKSTLLRCLNRLLEPPVGTVFLDSADITAFDVITLRRRVGMLFQSAALFPGSVADNVAYGPKLHDQTLAPERIHELLAMASLPPEVAQKPAAELSGGQAQRVALARALANEPEVLLLDEPTSALDPKATRQVEETILKLRETLRLTVVWVSHSVEQVSRTADQLVLLVAGRVVEAGEPEHLLRGEHHHLTEDFAAGTLETDQLSQSTHPPSGE